jgi:hypothetical protein
MMSEELKDTANLTHLEKVILYYMHGFFLGVIALLSFFIFQFIPWQFTPYGIFFTNIDGAPLLHTSVLLGLTFVLLGGVNQVLRSHFWRVEVGQNAAIAMIDGFLIHISLQIVTLPGSMLLMAFLAPSSPLYNGQLGFLLVVPLALIYLPIYGAIGRSVPKLLMQRT